MPRVTFDLNDTADRQKVKGEWRVGEGFVPGEPNEGLTARLLASPPRTADFDDSDWPVCTNIRESLSEGFTFAWYRITVEVPQEADGLSLEGGRLWFETNVDNYGEVWVNGEIDRSTGVIVGINAPQRIELSPNAVPGGKYVIACLVANGPLAEPRGGIFMRFATLVVETSN
ncbi:MAG: hypothetical protein H8E48_04570 [Chloroflexi bacterium]|nr:hypothetical protein [Chloroflexota bacterium]